MAKIRIATKYRSGSQLVLTNTNGRENARTYGYIKGLTITITQTVNGTTQTYNSHTYKEIEAHVTPTITNSSVGPVGTIYNLKEATSTSTDYFEFDIPDVSVTQTVTDYETVTETVTDYETVTVTQTVTETVTQPAVRQTVTQTGIMAVLFDAEACAMCCENPVVESQRNAQKRVTNFFHSFDAQYMNDTGENCVVFVIADN